GRFVEQNAGAEHGQQDGRGEDAAGALEAAVPAGALGGHALEDLVLEAARHLDGEHGAAEVLVEAGVGPGPGVALAAVGQVLVQLLGLAGADELQVQAGGVTIHRSPSSSGQWPAPARRRAGAGSAGGPWPSPVGT